MTSVRDWRGSWVPVVLLALLAAVGCGKKKSDGVDAATTASLKPSASPAAAADPASMDPAAAAAYGFKLYDAAPPDDKGAIPFFDRACKAGDQTGCVGIGLANLDGRGGVAQDYAKAFELLDHACQQKLMRACSSVGGMKYFAKGMKEDKSGARAMWQQACDGGEPRGCYMLGLAYTAADGPREWHDMKAGLALLQKACAGGNKDGCEQVKKAEAAEEIDALKAKVKRERGVSYEDDKCASDGKPPRAYEFTGGTYKENEQVAVAGGCVHLHHVSDYAPPDGTFNNYCCPK